MYQPADINLAVDELLRHAGLSAEIFSITPASAGGNNRIYRVEAASGVYAAKQYFRHAGDRRDRLSSEYAFLQYAGKMAPGFVPQAYACNHDTGLALFEFVDGVQIKAGEVDWQHVEQAVNFFCALNDPASRPKVLNLPKASEACFAIADHLALVDARIGRLREALSALKNEEQGALQFLDELSQYWIMLTRKVSTAAEQAGQLDQPLDLQNCCVSPSDFGFHNALLQNDKHIRFIDFEYAGIDDPAKMAGDFFAQLAVPVPAEFYEEFVRQCMQVFPDQDDLIARAGLLRPVYKVKWCCIAMNVFLPEHMARRKFANAMLDEKELKQTQLNKARHILKTLQQETINGIH